MLSALITYQVQWNTNSKWQTISSKICHVEKKPKKSFKRIVYTCVGHDCCRAHVNNFNFNGTIVTFVVVHAYSNTPEVSDHLMDRWRVLKSRRTYMREFEFFVHDPGRRSICFFSDISFFLRCTFTTRRTEKKTN